MKEVIKMKIKNNKKQDEQIVQGNAEQNRDYGEGEKENG